MPIDLSFAGIVKDIMVRSGVGLALIVLIAYRLFAVSLLPCLMRNYLYSVFYLVVVVSFSFLSPCIENFIEVLIFALLLFVPDLSVGIVGLLKKWNFKKTIFFATLEILLFPLWFLIVFTIALLIEGSE